MLLVDPRWIDQRQTTPLPDPMSRSLTELDSQMRDILERQDLAEQHKAHLYHQTLQRYLTRFYQIKGRPLGRVDVTPPQDTSIADASAETSDVEKNVLDSVPTTLKKKAEQLLHHLKQNSDLGWNERGEITRQGQTIENSNLIDLVNDVLRHRKQTKQPTGWDTFATALNQSNVAKELIGHPDRWQAIQLQKSADQQLSQQQQEKTTWETPVKKRKSRKEKRVWEAL